MCGKRRTDAKAPFGRNCLAPIATWHEEGRGMRVSRKTVVLGLSLVIGSIAPAAAQQQGGHDGGAAMHDRHHSFGDAEKWAKQFDDPARDKWQMPARVIPALAIKPTDVVADIGAGTGYFTVHLAHAAREGRVFAVDVEPAMVKHLRERASRQGLANVTAVQGSTTSANLPQKVDLALLVDVYHHIDGRVDYFRKLSQSLKPGGRVAIIDFRIDAKQGAPKRFRMSPDTVASEMKQAGYRQSASHDFLPHQYFLVFERDGG
jgi:SAM-dependent methyltransferase